MRPAGGARPRSDRSDRAGVSTGTAAAQSARTLTFGDRVSAQEAIERVYYSHQVGARKPFEEAVPAAVLEDKVRRYLEQTAALGVYWKTSVTDEMLQRELERMARGTRMPDRLIELYAALDNDPFLIKECLARATLVERLTHNFYAFDRTLHAEARQRAEELHRLLSSGELSPTTDQPNRSLVELAVSDTPIETSTPFRRQVSPDEFRAERALLPDTVGRVSALEEERQAFVLSVVLSETASELSAAKYVVPKPSWDAWWGTARVALRVEPTATVASDNGPLPKPTAGLSTNSLPCAADDTWDKSTAVPFCVMTIG